MLLKMPPPSSCALGQFLFEQKGRHVRLSVSYLLNRESKLLTLYLLWGFLNSHEPRLPWNPVLLEHLHPVMQQWDGYEKETSTYTLSLTLLLVCKLWRVTEFHVWNSKTKFQVDDSKCRALDGQVIYPWNQPCPSLGPRRVTRSNPTLKGWRLHKETRTRWRGH